MVEFRQHHEAVYIFENLKAQRVKVGMTSGFTVTVDDRLRDVNDKWLGIKATCQICGGRRLINTRGLVPQHVVSGIGCSGGSALPLEKDVALAESHLENLKIRLSDLSGSEKGSVTRIIKTLEKRIVLYRDYKLPAGVWQLNTAFYTEGAGQVELLSHEILAERLDRLAPFGEVFCCSVSEATEAVETALSQLGLLHTARKEIKKHDMSDRKYVTSEKYGKCVICGNNLAATGACPDCMRRF